MKYFVLPVDISQEVGKPLLGLLSDYSGPISNSLKFVVALEFKGSIKDIMVRWDSGLSL